MLKRRINLATAAAGAALVAVAVAGCGSNAQPIQVNLAASEVLAQAAQKTAEVTSYTVDAVVETAHPQESKGKVQGRMLYQSKPQLAADLTLDTLDMGGKGLPGGVRAVLQGDVVYVKVEALKELVGATKPWIKVSLSEMGGSGEVKQYLDQIQQFDLASVTKMVTASKDVKSVGTESVDGADTTHYSGTFPVDVAVQQLPADQREQASRNLAELKDVKFDIWVDSDGLPRKLALSGAKEGATLNATLFFKGFNEPVKIEAPPADQVGELPKGTTN
ncbi:LppX_LprAFG lipoprotein [Nonomuraea cavernae]|uniref:Lipoprotein n=1 Tax=Nonomuraea cavernae TaxID=2045107 RepID=A0A918DJL7_9ACTN|nr:LppX_LprAFG lipoprotein [Nonomuraea cavernae]MCA2187220.1 LppX_LprAFG lipoprotein [Nonomuraea cavernae]GGO67946.1 putative lipoprotein [Nonomuraea cavernae]